MNAWGCLESREDQFYACIMSAVPSNFSQVLYKSILMPSMERRRESGNEASWNQEQQEWNNQYTLVKSATEPYS